MYEMSLSQKMGFLMVPVNLVWVLSSAAVWDECSVVTTLDLF